MDNIHVRNPKKLTEKELDAFRTALFQEQEEHDVGGSDDEGASDESVSNSEHDTESELEADEYIVSENEEMDAIEEPNLEPCFVGKDNITIWRKHPVKSKFAKHAQKNLVKIFPRPASNQQGVPTPEKLFQQFITLEMVDEIVKSTNIFIQQKQDAFSRIRDAKETTRDEILAFFGLLYIIGIKKQSHTDFHEIWDHDEGNIISRSCMGSKRFLFLLRAIRFDDITSRQERRLTDKLAPIRLILDAFVSNCKTNYVVGDCMTIDEMLIPYRGRCSFIQYLPNKPAKYGLKVFALCDSKTFYVSNLELCCGKQPDGPYFNQSNTPFEIVSRLVDPYKGKNRNLTCDNWYSSYPLAKDLLKKKITMVGTLKKNKREIPIELLPYRHRPAPSSIFAFQEDVTLVSFCPKKSKAVLLVSTMHDDDVVDEHSQKPDIILFYNSTKGGIDTVDQQTANYTVQRRCIRWPLVIFFQVMNIAALNSYIVYKFYSENEVSRRDFLKMLAFSLTKPHLQIMANTVNLPCDVKQYLKKYKPNIEEKRATTSLRGKCSLCEWKKNRVTTIQCSVCESLACKEHVVTTHICLACKANHNEEDDDL